MSAKARIYWIHAITPLHVGAGRGVSFIDLPIMREKITGWPLVPGSTVKGVWRSHFEPIADKAILDAAFGPDSEQGDHTSDTDHAGSLVLTDARLVLLPVRSYFGTFAYVTSTLVLHRLRKDLESAGLLGIPGIPGDPGEGRVLVTRDSAVSWTKANPSGERQVFFEELDFSAEVSDSAAAWADFFARQLFADDPTMSGLFQKRFAILNDGSFDFLSETGTEVSARVRIKNETKTVAGGALWYEESLPAETVLAGLAWCDRVYGSRGVTPEKILSTLCGQSFTCQIGGKATVGKGRVRCGFSGKEG